MKKQMKQFYKIFNNIFSLQACLDRTVLMNFVQLRADYKTAKLVNQFR